MTDPDCLFCKIVNGDVPAQIVHESDKSVAFRDINPQAPVHVLVIPRSHHANAAELATEAPDDLADLFRTAAAVVEAEGLKSGYRQVFNTGSDAQQTVFHAHLHVLGGRGFTWPPG